MIDRLFIVGKGRSLRGFDFSKLKDEFTIALHSAVFWFPASAVYVCSQQWIKDNDLTGFPGMVYGGKKCGKQFKFAGLSALSMSLSMADKIYLLGYDMHRVDGNPYAIPDTGDQAEFLYRLSGWVDARAKLFDKHFSKYTNRIFNCNPESNIKTFKFVDIDEVLSEN